MTDGCSWGSRLRRPVFLWGAAALATQLTVERLFKHREPRSPAQIFLGFLPAFMWIIFTVAFVRGVLKSDEFQQRIQLQAASIAFVLTVVLTLVFAGLERAGIYRVAWSDIGGSLMLLLLIGYIFSAWRYR
jgi:hypothetical protein